MVRILDTSEKKQALALAWDCFLTFVAPDCTEEGVATFRNFLENEDQINDLVFYGAYNSETLCGMLAFRENKHISLLFVAPDCQNKGFGRALVEAAKSSCTKEVISVHASPYAVEFYRKNGFITETPEKTENGIRHTPMVYRIGEYTIG